MRPAEPCDRCGHPAAVRVWKNAEARVLAIWWCKHHYETHEAQLAADGWRISVDDRRALAVKP